MCVSLCEWGAQVRPPGFIEEPLRRCCGSRWNCACAWEAWCGGGAWVSQGDRTGGGGCKVEGEVAEEAGGRPPLWHAQAWTWPTVWADVWLGLGWGRPPSAPARSGPPRSTSLSAGTGWVFLGVGLQAARGWAGRGARSGPEAGTQCWAGSVDRSAACCELTPSLGTVRERMRSYQPERSLYAALRCVTHMGMQVGMQSERMQNTHSVSLFLPIMFIYMIYTFSQKCFTHTSPETEKGNGIRRDFGQRSWRERFDFDVCVGVRTW